MDAAQSPHPGTGQPITRDACRPSIRLSDTRRTRPVRARGLIPALLFHGIGLAAAAEGRKVTFEDDVVPIFRDNCLKCHNPDKLKGDLDLTSFSAAIKGGGSGATLNPGDPDGSLLLKSITHAEEPSMPPNSKLSERDITTIRRWIEGGLLQGANSKALAANKPTVDLTLKAGSLGRPDGPPPLPGPLSLDPVVQATRSPTIAAAAHSPWAPVAAIAGARQVVMHRTDLLEFAGVLPFPEGTLCDLKFSRNGRLLLAGGGRGGQSGVVVVWDITSGARVITIGDQYDSVLAADLSSDQQWIALGGPDRVLKIYRTRDGGLEHRIKKHTEWVTAIEFSPDSKYLASGDRNGGLVLWETETGQELFTLPGHRGAITAITWRSDSAMFFSASEDGTLKLWKASDGSALRSVNAHPGGVLAARFASDGRVASCGRDNKVQLWDITGKNVRTLPFVGELPNRVMFTDDSRKVIAGDWQGRVLVWDAATGKDLGELEANPPRLAERVPLGLRRVAARQAASAQANAALAAQEAELTAVRGESDRAKAALAEARSVAEKSAPKTKLTALEKEKTALEKQLAAAEKRVTESRAAAADAKARLSAAEASLAHWKSVVEKTPTEGGADRRKVTLR